MKTSPVTGPMTSIFRFNDISDRTFARKPVVWRHLRSPLQLDKRPELYTFEGLFWDPVPCHSKVTSQENFTCDRTYDQHFSSQRHFWQSLCTKTNGVTTSAVTARTWQTTGAVHFWSLILRPCPTTLEINFTWWLQLWPNLCPAFFVSYYIAAGLV